MTAYLIKSVLCSALLFLVYKLLFESEKTLHFNRFYLLFSLVFSFIVPFVTIEGSSSQILPEAEVSILNKEVPVTVNNIQGPALYAENDTSYFVLLTTYIIIATILLFRFGLTIKILLSRLSYSTSIPYKAAKLILIDNNSTPHSFLNYIFISSEDYNKDRIENEILLHELTHVQQKHSIDVLFTELIQALFWFNPIVILYRNAIQLNHEFLADEGVICTYNNVLLYQHLLLDKAGQRISPRPTSSFNYSVTKKRLIMMTKSTSAKNALCKQLALIPLAVAAVFAFSTRTIAQDTINRAKSGQKEVQSTEAGVSQELLNEYEALVSKNKMNKEYAIGTFPPTVPETDRNRLQIIYLAMSKAQQAKQTVTFEPMKPLKRERPTEEQFKAFKNSRSYAIIIDDKKVDNIVLNRFKPSDFEQVSVIYLAKTNKKYGKRIHIAAYLMTKEYHEAYTKKMFSGKTPYVMTSLPHRIVPIK